MKGKITKNSEGAKPILFWWNFGVGVSDNYRLSGVISASLQFDRHLVSIRALGTTEVKAKGFMFTIGDISEMPAENTFDIGVLYGRVGRGKSGFASIAAGISYVGGVQRGEFLYNDGITDYYEEVDIQTIGVPIEIQLFLTSFFTSRFFTSGLIGVGIYGFANINPEAPFIGFAFCIQLGILIDPLLPREK